MDCPQRSTRCGGRLAGLPSRRALRRSAAAVVFCALPVLAARPATAQNTGSLSGVVKSRDGQPLDHATVSISGTALAALADSAGSFRISAVPQGDNGVEVRLLGYAPTHLRVIIGSGKASTLEIVLTPIAVHLDAVTVSGDTLTIPAIRGFLERKAGGNGQFLTRGEIEHMHARLFTDILRRIPGMQLQLVNGTMSNNYTVRTGRNSDVQGSRQCPVLFFMNGMPFPMQNGSVINSYVAPEDVTALEVYQGASQIPAQFNASAFNARCGVIVIWTLNGTESRKKQ